MFSSSPKRNAATSYPDVPASLEAGSFEMSDLRKVQEARADPAPSVTPYLNLPSRLSQIWINRWTVLLLLVLVRVVLLIARLSDNVGDAKVKALSACTKVEDVGSAMASMPHYLSVGVNELAAGGIEKAVHTLVTGLDLVMRAVEAIILFYINFLTATYVCLITALVHASLDVVASVTKDATKAFNQVVDEAAHEIQDIASGLQDGINKVTKGIESSVLGHLIPDIPKVDFSKPLEKLTKFDLNSDDFVKDVHKLNSDLPNFEQVQNLTKEAISIPFGFARKALNQSLNGYRFNRDVFPRARKQRLTFCSDNDTLQGFFRHLFELVHKARVAFVVLLSMLAAGAMAPMAWLEVRRWRQQQRHTRLITGSQYDPMDVVYIVSHPTTATYGINIASKLRGRRQILARWCVAYGTSVPALFVLSLAAAGFFSCFCHFILLKAVEKEVPALGRQVGEFAGQVVTALEKVSDEWAADVNGVVKGLNDDINKDVLIYVTNATDAVNKTLNVFLDTMEEGLETVFNGTILLDPIKAVLHCAIGIKVESVQHGLTWVHEHAHVELPLFNKSTFSLGAKESVSSDSDLHTFLASPSTVTTDDVTGAVKVVADRLHDSLVQEALISTGILLVYIIVVLFGVVRTLACMFVPDPARAQGGLRYEGDDWLPPDTRSGPGPGEGNVHGAAWETTNEKKQVAASCGQGTRARQGARA